MERHLTDRTGYQRRVWEEDIGSLPFEDEGRRNVAELAELVVGMRDFDDETAMATYIELMNPHFDFIPALEMAPALRSGGAGDPQTLPGGRPAPSMKIPLIEKLERFSRNPQAWCCSPPEDSSHHRHADLERKCTPDGGALVP